MPVVKEVSGDLLKAEEKFIAQQCNCVTVKSHGLSESIIRHFGSWADPYSSRSSVSQGRNCASGKDIDIPGTIRILESPSASSTDTQDLIGRSGFNTQDLIGRSGFNTQDLIGRSGFNTRVICMFAQWCPGKPGVYSHYYPSDYDDTVVNRFAWFKQCLVKIDEDDKIDGPVAMPYNIGCGLAGGYWPAYRKALDEVETDVILYKL